MKRYLIALLLLGCGVPLPTTQPTLQKSATITASTATTNTTSTTTTQAAPLDGDWHGGWSQSYTPGDHPAVVGAFCGTSFTRSLTVQGTLTLKGTAATFAGTVSDVAYRWVYDTYASRWWCLQSGVLTTVSQAITATTNTNSVDFTGGGTGAGDWHIGSLTARRADTDTHLVMDTDPVFAAFEFWKK